MNTRKKFLAAALAFLIGFSPMVPSFITCADEAGSTQETTVSETTDSETSEAATEQTESIKSAGGEGTVYCCKLLHCMKVYDFRQLFQKLTKIKF